eukprot:c3762_g1_i2.p1 GENE.c3762_g1_i2~~c3762_g1_i2.p1  ORF type:complete len:175 (+),score=37.11 c3762_g1_i2:66-527(+)
MNKAVAIAKTSNDDPYAYVISLRAISTSDGAWELTFYDGNQCNGTSIGSITTSCNTCNAVPFDDIYLQVSCIKNSNSQQTATKSSVSSSTLVAVTISVSVTAAAAVGLYATWRLGSRKHRYALNFSGGHSTDPRLLSDTQPSSNIGYQTEYRV